MNWFIFWIFVWWRVHWVFFATVFKSIYGIWCNKIANRAIYFAVTFRIWEMLNWLMRFQICIVWSCKAIIFSPPPHTHTLAHTKMSTNCKNNGGQGGIGGDDDVLMYSSTKKQCNEQTFATWKRFCHIKSFYFFISFFKY